LQTSRQDFAVRTFREVETTPDNGGRQQAAVKQEEAEAIFAVCGVW
jgi:hypothetical protein